ncbi:MAG: MerR family transcriptional regulator [Acidobacteriota bacterium]
MRADRELTLAELAEEAGLPARTVRYYIARELLPGPLRGGRGAAYGREHLERLGTIRRLQAKGLTLVEIARRLSGEKPGEALPAPAAWWSYPVGEDVQVWVRADASPWRLRQVRKALGRLAAELTKESEESDGNG